MIREAITYKILFHQVPDDASIKDPTDLPISSERVSPKDAKVSKYVIEMLRNLARDYVFSLSEQKLVTKGVRAEVCLSSSQGIEVTSSNDERFVDLVKEFNKSAISLPRNMVEERGLLGVKRSEPPKEREASLTKGQESPIFLNLAALTMATKKLKDIAVNLEIGSFVPSAKGGGLTTAPLRFPHLYFDAITQYKPLINNPSAKICIVGPGLHLTIGKSNMPWCPQFIELLGLFPQARFTLLDNDPKAVKKLQQQLEIVKLGFYDPLMLRTSTYMRKDNPLLAPKKYHPLLLQMQENLAEIAVSPTNAYAMLLRQEGTVTRLAVKVPEGAVKVENFDILTSSFEKDQCFDIMVATLSFCNAFKCSDKKPVELDHLAILAKFVKNLNVNGVMYIDYPSLQFVMDVYGYSNVVHFVEVHVGHKLSIREVPLSDFLPETISSTGSILSLLISFKVKSKIPSITSYSVYAITKLPDKIDF